MMGCHIESITPLVLAPVDNNKVTYKVIIKDANETEMVGTGLWLPQMICVIIQTISLHLFYLFIGWSMGIMARDYIFCS